MHLRGTRVIVVGGSSGIGLAAARLTKEAGAEVTIVGRSPVRLKQAQESLGGVRAVGWSGQVRGKPRTCSSSARATAGSVTLIVSMPMRRAGLRFTPRSSRNTASEGSMPSVVQAIS